MSRVASLLRVALGYRHALLIVGHPFEPTDFAL